MNKPIIDRRHDIRLLDVGLGEIDRDTVMDALSRVTTSERFRNSERICDFLRYIVEETLEGRGAMIKAHSIAVDVFSRNNFDDESSDAIVRTSAHRLRLFLEGYFNNEGRNDPCWIILNKGSYVPKFCLQAFPEGDEYPVGTDYAAPDTADVRQPRHTRWLGRQFSMRKVALAFCLVAILTAAFAWNWFRAAGDLSRPNIVVTVARTSNDLPDTLASGMQRRLVANLVAFGSATILDQNYRKDATATKNMLSLDVSLVASNGVVADWKLTDASTGAVIWTGQQTLNSSGFDALNQGASAIASSVLGQEGALAIWAGTGSDLDTSRRCLFETQMRSTQLLGNNERMRRCLVDLTRKFPNDATPWALLSLTYFRLAIAPRDWNKAEDQRFLALQQEALARAIEISPNTFYTKVAQLFSLYSNRDRQAFDQVSNQLLNQYAGYPNLRTTIASKLVQGGRHEEAKAMIESKRAMGAALHEVDDAILVLALYFEGDYQSALPLVDRVSDDQTPMAVVLKIAVYGQLGLRDKARQSWSRLALNYPEYPKLMDRYFRNTLMPDRNAAMIREGLRKAGVPSQ